MPRSMTSGVGSVRRINMPKKKTPAEDWVHTLVTDPKKIIGWAKREIKEYENLIKIIEIKWTI